MRDKVIAVMDKPKNCQNCVWGICKYSTPLSTNRKGYYCQLKEPKDRNVEDFAYEDEVHLSDCPLALPEEHDKEIRNKAIEELKNKICSYFADWKYSEDDKWIKDIIELASEGIEEIAEKMKEVGE